MAEIRGLIMRVQAVDDGFVRVMTQAAGEGFRAFERMEGGTQRVRRGTDNATTGLDRLIHRLRGTAATIAVLDGPLGGVASRFNAFATTLSVFQGRMLLVGLGLAGLGIGVGAFLVAVTRTVGAGQQLERQLARLDAQINLTQGRFAGSAEQINQIARRIGEETLANAQEVRDAASSALAFEGVGTGNLERVLEIAQDMTEIFGGDLLTNVQQLGKAFVDPGMSMDELRRKGIDFTATQRQMIDNLVEMGRNAEAAEIILARAEERVGGIAKAAATETLAGQWDTIVELTGQVSENLGTGYTLGIVKWILGFTQIQAALEAIRGLTESVDPIKESEDRLATLTSQLKAVQENVRTAQGMGLPDAAAEAMWGGRAEALEREIALEKERLAARRGAVQVLDLDFQVENRRRQQEAARQKLENELYDARQVVQREIGKIEFEVGLVGLPESKVEFERFVAENFATLSPEIRPDLDLGPLEAAFAELERRQKAFEAEQKRIQELEQNAPIPRLVSRFDREGFARGAGAPVPVLKPDSEIRDEFEAIRQQVMPLNVELERLIAHMDVLAAAESAGIDVGGVEAVLEREAELVRLQMRSAEVAAQFREHFGAAANDAAGFVESGAQRMSRALGDFVVGQSSAAEAFTGLWRDVFEDLARRAMQFAILTALTRGAAAAGSGPLGTILAGMAGGLSRAEGGPAADQRVLVGEKGPEVVQMHGSGWVYPTHSPLTKRALQYLGRAHFGGEMTVGGQGGPDSQLVAVRATPGERISVSQPQRAHLRADVNVRGMGESVGDVALAQQVAAVLWPQIGDMVRGQVLDLQERHRMLASR